MVVRRRAARAARSSSRRRRRTPAARCRSGPAAAPVPLTDAAHAAEDRLRTLSPPPDAELPAEDLAALRAHGRAVRVGPSQHFHMDVLADDQQRLVSLLEAEGR